MTLPKQADVEIPLLEEIEKAGGSAKPKDLYPRVTEHFPDITPEDRLARIASGHLTWSNRIQWVRQELLNKGELDGSVRNVWAITERGRKRLEGHRKGLPFDAAKVRKKPGRKRRVSASEKLDHDGIARTLIKIGDAFGFETFWKPKVNDIKPDRKAFKAKRKTLDVGWEIANLTWVAIEVQVAGSVPDLIYRFQQVHQWSLRLIVVAGRDHREEIQEAVRDYPFRDKVVLLDPKEVTAATRSLDRLLDLRAKIFE